MPSNIEDIFEAGSEAEAAVILENYRRNGISEPMSKLLKEERDLALDSKIHDDYKLKFESNETEILKKIRGKGCLDDEALIERCRKSEIYKNLLYALHADYLYRSYYDIDRINSIFLKTYTATFENLREKKGLNKDEEEDTGITIALIGYVAMRDLVGSLKDSNSLAGGTSLYDFMSLRFSSKVKSWTEWLYFWGRNIWDVASWTAIIGGAISACFIATNVVVAAAIVLSGSVVKYVFDYVLRTKNEIVDNYKRYDKLAGSLKRLDKIYNEVNKNKPFKIEKLKDVELVRKGYDEKRFFKLFSDNFKISSVVLGIISVVSLSLLIPGLAPVFLAKALPFALLVSVGSVSGVLSISSLVGMFVCKRKYESLKKAKTDVIKAQEKKGLNINKSIKEKLEKIKNEKDKKAKESNPLNKDELVK